MKPILLILIAIIVIYFVNRRYNLPDDNPVEEYAEEIVENQTKIDLDITPSTPEHPISEK